MNECTRVKALLYTHSIIFNTVIPTANPAPFATCFLPSPYLAHTPFATCRGVLF